MEVKNNFTEYYMKEHLHSDKKVSPARRTMKARKKNRRKSTIQEDYRRVFSPVPPTEGQYLGEESLEQPSALRYVPSTTRTTESATDFQTLHDAKLARDIY